jgi:hypothetical protein
MGDDKLQDAIDNAVADLGKTQEPGHGPKNPESSGEEAPVGSSISEASNAEVPDTDAGPAGGPASGPAAEAEAESGPDDRGLTTNTTPTD